MKLRSFMLIALLGWMATISVMVLAVHGKETLSSSVYLPLQNISIKYSTDYQSTMSNLNSDDVQALFIQPLKSMNTMSTQTTHEEDVQKVPLLQPFGETLQISFEINQQMFQFDLTIDDTAYGTDSVITAGDGSTDAESNEQYIPSITTYHGIGTTDNGEEVVGVFTLTPQVDVSQKIYHTLSNTINGQSNDIDVLAYAPLNTPQITFQGTVLFGGESIEIMPLTHHLMTKSDYIEKLEQVQNNNNSFQSLSVEQQEELATAQEFMRELYDLAALSTDVANQQTYQLLALSSVDRVSPPCGAVDEDGNILVEDNSHDDDSSDQVEVDIVPINEDSPLIEPDGDDNGDGNDEGSSSDSDEKPIKPVRPPTKPKKKTKESKSRLASSNTHRVAQTLPATYFLKKWSGCTDLTTWDARASFTLSITTDYAFGQMASGSNTVNLAKVTTNVAQSVATMNLIYEATVSTFYRVSRLSIRTATNPSEVWNKSINQDCDSLNLFEQFRVYAVSTAYGTRDTSLVHLLTACTNIGGGGYAGVAHVGGMCTTNSGIGWSNLKIGTYHTLTHEIGHNHALRHTFFTGVYPQGIGLGIMDYGDSYIKAAVASSDPNFGRIGFAELTDKTTLCNTIQTLLTTSPPRPYCQTIHYRKNVGDSLCGNGIHDPMFGEECDPGSDTNHPCCTNQCKFKTGAQCSTIPGQSNDCCTSTCQLKTGWCNNGQGMCTTVGCKYLQFPDGFENCATESEAFPPTTTPAYKCWMHMKQTGGVCGWRSGSHHFDYGYPCELTSTTRGTCVPSGTTGAFDHITCAPTTYQWLLGPTRSCNCAEGAYYSYDEYFCANNGNAIVASSHCTTPKPPQFGWCGCSAASSLINYNPQTIGGVTKCYRTLTGDSYYKEEVALSFCGL